MKNDKKKLLISAGFEDQVKNIESNRCSWCGSEKVKPEDFKDALSIKEHAISGMCQKCQDETFG